MTNPTKQFKVESIENTETKVTLKGGGFYWSIWKNHEIYPIYQEMEDIAGKDIEVEYYEKPNPKNAEFPFKNVVGIIFIDSYEEVGVKSSTKVADTDLSNAKTDWDRVNFEKDTKIGVYNAMKCATSAYPVKDTWTKPDYDEIENRFNWIDATTSGRIKQLLNGEDSDSLPF